MIFGMTIAEFIAVLGSLVAIIITIFKADKTDVATESVQTLLDPLNEEIEKLRGEIVKLNQDYTDYRERVRKWRGVLQLTLDKIIKELAEVKANIQEEE